MKRPSWTPAEITALRALFPRASRAEILAAIPDRDWHCIRAQASRYGIVRIAGKVPRVYGDCAQCGAPHVRLVVSRKCGTRYCRSCYNNNFVERGQHPRRKRREWTLEEIDTLRDTYPTSRRAVILAAIPLHGWNAIVRKATHLQIARQEWAEEDDTPLPIPSTAMDGDMHPLIADLIACERRVLAAMKNRNHLMGKHYARNARMESAEL